MARRIIIVLIRHAEPHDVPLLKNMIEEMGSYERLPVTVTEQELLADGFGQHPRFHALLALWNRDPAGYALFHDCYSSFQGKGTFLEDLYVRPDFRKNDIATALLAAVANVAIKANSYAIVFNVLAWNDKGLGFFKRAGAAALTEWTTMNLTGNALRAAAQHG